MSIAAVRIVFVMVAANAATQFAIQAWMSFRFARDVWVIPGALCVAVIIALDLFAVTYMIFTYLLRTAKFRTRAYAWLVFAIGVGAQLFAAELYGAHENWTITVRIFAALPALFLAASLHGLIIWRNHAATVAPDEVPAAPAPAPTPRPEPTRHVAAEPERTASRPPVTERPPRPAVAPAAPLASSGRKARPASSGQEARDNAAYEVISKGRAAKDVAAELGVSRRAVEQWVKARREATPAFTLPPITQGVVTQADPEPVNGHSFDTKAQVN